CFGSSVVMVLPIRESRGPFQACSTRAPCQKNPLRGGFRWWGELLYYAKREEHRWCPRHSRLCPPPVHHTWDPSVGDPAGFLLLRRRKRDDGFVSMSEARPHYALPGGLRVRRLRWRRGSRGHRQGMESRQEGAGGCQD